MQASWTPSGQVPMMLCVLGYKTLLDKLKLTMPSISVMVQSSTFYFSNGAKGAGQGDTV